MRLYNFRRNQSAWGNKSDMSHGSRGPKIYQGDKGQDWTQTMQLTVNGDKVPAPSTMSHSHKSVPACVTGPEWECLQETRTQACTAECTEQEKSSELSCWQELWLKNTPAYSYRADHKTALTISSQTKIREHMRISNDQTRQNGRIHMGRRKDVRATREGLHKKCFLNPRRNRRDLHPQSEKRFQ